MPLVRMMIQHSCVLITTYSTLHEVSIYLSLVVFVTKTNTSLFVVHFVPVYDRNIPAFISDINMTTAVEIQSTN